PASALRRPGQSPSRLPEAPQRKSSRHALTESSARLMAESPGLVSPYLGDQPGSTALPFLLPVQIPPSLMCGAREVPLSISTGAPAARGRPNRLLQAPALVKPGTTGIFRPPPTSIRRFIAPALRVTVEILPVAFGHGGRSATRAPRVIPSIPINTRSPLSR